MAQQSLVGQGLSSVEATPSHSDTPHSVGLLWTSDHPDAETSTWQRTTLTTEIHADDGIRTRNPKKWAATGPRLRARDPRDQPQTYNTVANQFIFL
jgi:hypothetical protein